MESTLETIKKYWWGVFLTLLGTYMVTSSIYSFIDLIVRDASSTYQPEIARAIVNWGWVLATWVVWLIGGAFVLESGISKIRKNLKIAREEGRK
jgi:hypothetical protein